MNQVNHANLTFSKRKNQDISSCFNRNDGFGKAEQSGNLRKKMGNILLFVQIKIPGIKKKANNE